MKLESDADAANIKYKIGNILGLFQEEPQLLDIVIPDLIEPLMKLV